MPRNASFADAFTIAAAAAVLAAIQALTADHIKWLQEQCKPNIFADGSLQCLFKDIPAQQLAHAASPNTFG